ncbi:hypothetical protein ACFQBS_35965 [Planomonospora parontospora]|uniref:hypothetical protein n=1 Tax=Planomonospora parontospora TaxID=58119 RepID=UPI003616A637
MFNISLGRGVRPDDGGDHPVNGSPSYGERSPLTPWSNGEGVREIREYKVNPRTSKDKRDRLSGRMLGVAGVLVFAAMVGAGFVTYASQLLFAEKHNHTGTTLTDLDQIRAYIVAALPDVGWIAMALVALVAALRGQSSLRARLGVLVFFGLSLGAQILYAPSTLEGILVAIIAPISLAWMLETLIIEVRRWAGHRLGVPMDETPILTGVLVWLARLLVAPVRALLWFVRLLLDWRGTWAGLREWVLDVAPLAPGRTRASLEAAAAIEQADAASAQAERIHAEATAAARQAEELAAAARAEREQAAAELAQIRTAYEALQAEKKSSASVRRPICGGCCPERRKSRHSSGSTRRFMRERRSTSIGARRRPSPATSPSASTTTRGPRAVSSAGGSTSSSASPERRCPAVPLRRL